MKKLLVLILFLFLGQSRHAGAEEVATEFFKITGATRCPVCGMFVEKHQQWLTQVRMSDDTMVAFDGVKDMAAYALVPQDFGAAKGTLVKDVAVKDYYTLAWTDGRRAFYVLGGDVLGPMGHELIPFASLHGAENFFKDHHGTRILSYAEIDPALIESLRKGHKMKGQGTAGMQ